MIVISLLNQDQIKGIRCELECALKFMEAGFVVSVPYGNTSRYDLLVDIGNDKYFRVQCKNACRRENGSYIINTSNMQFTANSKRVKHYTKEQIDYICSIVENQLVVIPVEMIEKSKSKTFRSRTYPPTNNCTTFCNWIEDFTIENRILNTI